jgi:hypothetical protein
MSAKRFSSRGVMIVLLAISLVGGGCATTSKNAGVSKPHRPQMITAAGPEEVDQNEFAHTLGHGFDLSDGAANVIAVLGIPLRMLCGGGSWKP